MREGLDVRPTFIAVVAQHETDLRTQSRSPLSRQAGVGATRRAPLRGVHPVPA